MSIKKKGSSKKKYFLIGTIIFVFILFIIISCSLLFYLLRPLDGLITEDKPILIYLCDNFQFKCLNTIMGYPCKEEFDSPYFDIYNEYENKQININTVRLLRWKNYHGCNESTKGYNGYDYIHIKGCSCENIIN